MSPKKPNDDFDMEYQHPDENLGGEMQSGEDFTPPPEKKQGRFSKLPKKKIGMALFIIVMVYLVYQFLSRQENEATQITRQEILQTTPSTPVKKPEVRKPAVTTTVVTQTTPAAVTPVVEEKVQALFKTSAPDETEVSNLRAQVQEMQQSLAGLQNSLLTLAGSVETLSNQVDELKAAPPPECCTVKPQEAVVEKKTKAKRRYGGKVTTGTGVAVKAVENVKYFVRALIPGRAWLMSTNGKHYTSVKRGDWLPGYGTVTDINVTIGTVTTDSGIRITFPPEIISYGPNDS